LISKLLVLLALKLTVHFFNLTFDSLHGWCVDNNVTCSAGKITFTGKLLTL
jgi:hypothetical protein